MELIYTNQLDGFDPNKRYRSADLFRCVESDVTAVIVVGEHPAIVDAYEAIDVEVSVVDLISQDKQETDPAKMGVADLRDWLTAQGIEFDPKASKAEIVKLIPAS
ncbi:HeH/LEM domain-containing protein [Pseudomonas piscis]|uniref:HeH/LEM domain-containing protein n=1 Tax=Pseudomonas piscis TaxID=2614538 RepID=UPI0021D57595|nr:HeH/LEM domain-containing protein [Pseudomonas piscis]MCU7645645.1 HeH/LEM domain-containing protein [Pseudomonas piscis]